MKPSLTIAKAIGVEIVRLRHSHKITQQKLADLVGLSVQQIQKYEYGESNISVIRLLKISEVFDVCIHTLLRPALEDYYKIQNIYTITSSSSLDVELVEKIKKLPIEKKQAMLNLLLN